jgi:hypothetical protein
MDESIQMSFKKSYLDINVKRYKIIIFDKYSIDDIYTIFENQLKSRA